MWPFNRKQNQSQSALPPEVHDYYKSEQRDRTNIAWLLGAGTLVATLVLAALLYFGGRAVYRAVAGNNEPPTKPAPVRQPVKAPPTTPPVATNPPATATPPQSRPMPTPAQTQPSPSPKPPSGLANTGPEEDL